MATLPPMAVLALTPVVCRRGVCRALLAFVAVMGGLCAQSAGAQPTPQLPERAYPAVVSLLEAGQPADALAALEAALANDSPDAWPVEALALRATGLQAAGRPAEAATAWTAVGTLEPTLTDFAERAAIESLLAADQPERAADRLLRLGDGNPAQREPDLMVRTADAYRRIARPDLAALHYREVLDAARDRSHAADAAALGLASTLEALGNGTAALEHYHRAQINHADSLTYVTARAEERRLAATLDRLPSAFSTPEYRALTERLAGASRFAETLELMEEWLGSSRDPSEIEALEVGIVDVLYRARRNAEAMARAQRFIDRFPASARAPDIRLIQFRLHVREGRTEDVRTRGYELWRGRVPGASRAQRRSAGLLLGAYLVSVGEIKAGLAVYRELYEASATDGQRRDILWRAGVAAVRDGQLDRAAVNLRALLRLRPDGDLALLGSYWLAITEAELGNRDTAASLLLELVERAPYSYYGVQAAAAYVRLIDPAGAVHVNLRLRPRDAWPTLSLPPDALTSPLYRAASVLARAGLAEPAAMFARRLADAFRRDRAVALLAARATAVAGQHHLVLGLIDRHFPSALERPVGGLPADLLELAYPRAHWDALLAAASRTRVDPLLMASVMRQESRYEAPVRSVVGAVGLFQLMPYTAEALAIADGMPIPDEADLKQPAVSASLGALLLGRLLDHFSGAVAPVAASYNAGEDLVETWWRAMGQASEPMFVDSIPYAETRTYVRRVLANYYAYQRIYAE